MDPPDAGESAPGRWLLRFFAINRGLSRRAAKKLPHARLRIADLYEQTVAERMSVRPGQIVVDVGGGKHCPFAKYRRPGDAARIVCVDLSEEAMEGNDDVDETRVADVVQQGLPFGDQEVDLVVSRSVLEHLPDVERLVAECARVLKPGGVAVHLFPGRWTPFAFVNQILPDAVARRLLHYLRPECVGVGGFKTYYDRCYHGGMTRLFRRHGFDIVRTDVTYFSSDYYEFFFPLFLLSAAYESVAYALKLTNLSARILLVARKSG